MVVTQTSVSFGRSRSEFIWWQ